MSHVFAIAPVKAAAIAGSEATFPIGRIFCVGRNYAAHAREMGSNPEREPPFFFGKFPQAAVPGGGTIPYPPKTQNFHYEAELVLAIGKAGASVDVAAALDLVFGYATGLDMTRRDLQFAARDQGKPWDSGKSFAYSAPIGTIRPASLGHLGRGAIRLTVNDVVKQEADLGDLIWSTAEVISELSRLERLLPGDVIYTGTPAGVGPALPGDRLEVQIDGLESLRVVIGEREAEFV